MFRCRCINDIYVGMVLLRQDSSDLVNDIVFLTFDKFFVVMMIILVFVAMSICGHCLFGFVVSVVTGLARLAVFALLGLHFSMLIWLISESFTELSLSLGFVRRISRRLACRCVRLITVLRHVWMVFSRWLLRAMLTQILTYLYFDFSFLPLNYLLFLRSELPGFVVEVWPTLSPQEGCHISHIPMAHPQAFLIPRFLLPLPPRI